MKKYIAEAFGTFVLALVVGLSLVGIFPIPTPILAVLTVGLFVYAIGHVSGGHINPAVTIGLWSVGKIDLWNMIKYLVAQFAGAGVALYLLSLISDGGNVNMLVSNSFEVGLAEFIGTFMFGFVIMAVVNGKTPDNLSGIVIAGALLLGISIASLLGSNGMVNPAVALGAGSFNLTYLFAPFLGSIAGMQAYRYFLKA